MKRIPQSHPLHNACAIVALTILVIAQTCLAFDGNEWRNSQLLEVPAKGLVHVNVPATTLDAAQPGLQDLRIIDSTGNQVPYLIERLLPEPESKMHRKQCNTSKYQNRNERADHWRESGNTSDAVHESSRRRRIE